MFSPPRAPEDHSGGPLAPYAGPVPDGWCLPTQCATPGCRGRREPSTAPEAEACSCFEVGVMRDALYRRQRDGADGSQFERALRLAEACGASPHLSLIHI